MNKGARFESPLEPFESPKELLNGAKEQLAELEPMCDAIRETSDYEIITHTDPKTREKIVKLRLKHRFPPTIRRLASSILKELKTALDQAFCDGALALGRKDAKCIHFPFGKDPEDLKRAVGTNCAGVDRELVDYCLTFKPYYGGDSDLWSMSSLAGSTHQRIIGTGFQDTTSFAEAIIQATGPLTIIINRWNDLHNELEVARLPPGSELHIKANFTLRLEVVFAGSAHALSYRPLAPSFHELISKVGGIVFGIETKSASILRERS